MPVNLRTRSTARARLRDELALARWVRDNAARLVLAAGDYDQALAAGLLGALGITPGDLRRAAENEKARRAALKGESP